MRYQFHCPLLQGTEAVCKAPIGPAGTMVRALRELQQHKKVERQAVPRAAMDTHRRMKGRTQPPRRCHTDRAHTHTPARFAMPVSKTRTSRPLPSGNSAFGTHRSTHTHTHTHTHSPTHPPTHRRTHARSHAHARMHPCTQRHTHSRTHPPNHPPSLPHSLTPSLPPSLPRTWKTLYSRGAQNRMSWAIPIVV